LFLYLCPLFHKYEYRINLLKFPVKLSAGLQIRSASGSISVKNVKNGNDGDKG